MNLIFIYNQYLDNSVNPSHYPDTKLYNTNKNLALTVKIFFQVLIKF